MNAWRTPAARSQPAASGRMPTFPRIYGGREWCALPEFGIACIQARIDPAVRRSQLQIQDLAPEDLDGRRGMRFRIRPLLDDDLTIVEAAAPLAELWRKTAAGDPAPKDPTIRTLVTLGDDTWPLDLVLVPHDADGFRLRLGRDAFNDRSRAGKPRLRPSASFLAGAPAILGPGLLPLDELPELPAAPRYPTRDVPCP